MRIWLARYRVVSASQDFIVGVIKKARHDASANKRLDVFARLCGITEPKLYSPVCGDVVTELLSLVAGGVDRIAPLLACPRSFVPLTAVLGAIQQIFSVDGAEVGGAGGGGGSLAPLKRTVLSPGNRGAPMGAPASASTGSKDLSALAKEATVIKRGWTMPAQLRKLLITRIEDLARPADEIEELTAQGGSVLWLDTDLVLDAVLAATVQKLFVDRAMLMALFERFDEDGNGVLSLDEFRGLIAACQSSKKINEHDLMELWTFVNEWDSESDKDSVTPQAFATACIESGLQLNYWAIEGAREQFAKALAQVEFFGARVAA
jgi:hypothetical protein